MSWVPREGPPQHRDRCTPPQLLPPPHNPREVGVEVETHQTPPRPQAVGGEECLKLSRSNSTTMKMPLQPWQLLQVIPSSPINGSGTNNCDLWKYTREREIQRRNDQVPPIRLFLFPTLHNFRRTCRGSREYRILAIYRQIFHQLNPKATSSNKTLHKEAANLLFSWTLATNPISGNCGVTCRMEGGGGARDAATEIKKREASS